MKKAEELPVIMLNGVLYNCTMDVTLKFIGGKWRPVLLWQLRDKPLRFSELKRTIPGITEKLLSVHLKQMVTDGLVHKTIFAEVPPHVEYNITDEGKTLLPVLSAIHNWGKYKIKKETSQVNDEI